MLNELADKIVWLTQISDLNDRQCPTIIFSNEFLDAFPVHRLGWDAKSKNWFEYGVTVESGAFIWTRIPMAHHASRITDHAPPEVLAVLPDGFTTEICPAAAEWWRAAGEVLGHGKLLTFDYGLAAEEFFTPQRCRGTLRSYHHHHVSDDLLAGPGKQDITAHVNFTTLQCVGESVGLTTEAFESQAKFLTRIAEKIWKTKSDFGEWTAARTRQFQTLTHPEHLGRPFRVLVQSRDGDRK